MGKPCKGCGSTTRPTPHPGPRCATCHRAIRKARALSAHGAYILRTYQMSEDNYWTLYAMQGGKCAWCQRATGEAKRLAIDHDHTCCPEVPTCGQCTRGLLCGPCNDTEGRLGMAGLLRGVDYLKNPPAKRIVTTA